MNNVFRRVKGQKEKIKVNQPAMIATYNHHMGGVDLLDGYLANMRPCIGGKKWYWMPLVNTVRLLQVAAYRAYVNLDHPGTSQLEFLRMVVAESVAGFTRNPGNRAGRQCALVVPRLLTEDHIPVPSEKQGRCRVCKSNSRMKCSICNVQVHEKFSCFIKLHEISE